MSRCNQTLETPRLHCMLVCWCQEVEMPCIHATKTKQKRSWKFENINSQRMVLTFNSREDFSTVLIHPYLKGCSRNKRLHTVYIPWLNTSDVRMRNWVTGSLVSTMCQANNRIGVHCPRLRSKLLCLAASVVRFPPRVESSVTDSSRVRKWGMYQKTKSPLIVAVRSWFGHSDTLHMD